MTTIRDLASGIVLRSLREGIDTSNATGRMVAGVLASLAELELELVANVVQQGGKRDGRGGSPSVGLRRWTVETGLAKRMHASGESASTIAVTLGVSRATVYRVLADRDDSEE